ncbi:MAG: lipopolysaccharide kinase InaA family protein [Planctomycetota bacterium]|jgi:tRNA A-37 threonylcarbamoyl transferase component Bud32
MREFPSKLVIENRCLSQREECLTCRSVLRSIPHSRVVYDGLWNQMDVIVKLFNGMFQSKRRAKREWKRLKSLCNRGLNSPKPLFYGRAKKGGWVVITERIDGALSVLKTLCKTKDKTQKLELLLMVCRELAKQNQKGVIQRDFHLDNFLLADGEIFGIDPGQMCFSRTELSRKESICQLVSLASCLSVGEGDFIHKLCREYASVRGWEFGNSDDMYFRKQLLIHTKKGLRRALKKCLRTNKRDLRIRGNNYIALVKKNFFKDAEANEFIEQIDKLMNEGRILKKGNTSYVSSVNWNGKDVVIKRYNHKGLIHSLRHTIKSSRAKRNWLNSHRLKMLGIPVSNPLAYIEKRKGLVVWQSYFVNKFVQARSFYDFLHDGNVNAEQKTKLNEQVIALFDEMDKYYISHTDPKPANILISDNGPVFIDLDAIKVNKCRWVHGIYQKKSIEKFNRKR